MRAGGAVRVSAPSSEPLGPKGARRDIAFVIPHPYVDAVACFREPIEHLADEGWHVDLYTTLSPDNPPPFFGRESVRVLLIDMMTRAGAVRLVGALVTHRPKYRWIVTVPQWGLHYAGLAGRLAGIPVGCISDELRPAAEATTPGGRRWAWRERRAHRRCAWTIALSEERADFIRREHGLEDDHQIFVVPNAARGPARRLCSHFYQETLAIPDDRCVLLHAGSWWWKLRFRELEDVASRWGAGAVLVLQGRLPDHLGAPLATPNIRVSPAVLPAELLDHAVSSAHIGLALYDEATANNRLMGTASGKVGLYMKNALPVIVTAQPSFEWIEREGCGVLVSDVAAIPAAIDRIRDNYSVYVGRVQRVYDERLDFDRRFRAVAVKLGLR